MGHRGRIAGVVSVGALVLLLCAGGGARAEEGRRSILIPSAAPKAAPPAAQRSVRERFVRIDRASLGDEIRLELFPGVTVDARRERTEVTGPTGSVWIGRTIDKQGRVFFSTVGDVTVGHVRARGEAYEIRYAGEGINAVNEIDTTLFGDDGCDDGSGAAIVRAASRTAGARPPSTGSGTPKSDPCNVIDLLVLYTPAAKDEAGGEEAIEAAIHLAISVSNMTFEDSAVTTRFSPVHIDEIDYVEAATENDAGDAFDDRDALRNTADGVMDEAHELRDRYCADVVHLITQTGGNGDNNWCGAAYVQDPAPDSGHEVNGFAVTVLECASSNWTFAHEMGHLFGARHDWYVDDATTPYTYAHGYVNRAERWRTIMAYNTECDDLGFDCDRIGLWSRPNEFFQGDPAGIPEGTSTSCVADDLTNPDCDAENWRVLNATDCTVANFRDRSECIASAARNVWMKDSWFDTGLEPDPWTVGDDMWKSPYIWVRNAIDPTGAYQHIHQNPEQGQTNYVYVKLHNDFDQAASGQLRLYYAEPSSGLVWPGDWTLAAENTVNIGAHATLLYPSAWEPPATGDFSLLARWSTPNSPSDPLTAAEGDSVSTNVRGNNNLVWRNVNAVNLVPNLTVPLPPFNVKATDPDTPVLDLAIELPDNDHNFLRAGGTILLDLGGLHDNWVAGGAVADGARPITHPTFGDVLEILDSTSGVATIEHVLLSRGEEGAIRFILTAPYVPPPPPFPPIDDDPPEASSPTGDSDPTPDLPVDFFALDIVQLEGTERVGGVGYEIHVEATGGSGAVPDGATVPGTPLLLSRDALGGIVLDWETSCSGSDVDYAVYEGQLGDFGGHEPVLCSTDGATNATLPAIVTSDSYFLVVPTDGLTEGSFGRNSKGGERPAGPSACRPHAVVTCN